MTLSQKIEELVAKDRLRDPHTIAEKLIADMNEEQLRLALEVALPTFVREVLSQVRRDTTTPTRVRAAGQSTRVGAIRDWHQRLLDSVTEVNGSYKHLGECTRDDVLAIAGSRRKLAELNRRAAQKYEALATLMNDHDATTVADLPAELLRQTLEDLAT